MHIRPLFSWTLSRCQTSHTKRVRATATSSKVLVRGDTAVDFSRRFGVQAKYTDTSNRFSIFAFVLAGGAGGGRGAMQWLYNTGWWCVPPHIVVASPSPLTHTLPPLSHALFYRPTYIPHTPYPAPPFPPLANAGSVLQAACPGRHGGRLHQELRAC